MQSCQGRLYLLLQRALRSSPGCAGHAALSAAAHTACAQQPAASTISESQAALPVQQSVSQSYTTDTSKQPPSSSVAYPRLFDAGPDVPEPAPHSAHSTQPAPHSAHSTHPHRHSDTLATLLSDAEHGSVSAEEFETRLRPLFANRKRWDPVSLARLATTVSQYLAAPSTGWQAAPSAAGSPPAQDPGHPDTAARAACRVLQMAAHQAAWESQQQHTYGSHTLLVPQKQHMGPLSKVHNPLSKVVLSSALSQLALQVARRLPASTGSAAPLTHKEQQPTPPTSPDGAHVAGLVWSMSKLRISDLTPWSLVCEHLAQPSTLTCQQQTPSGGIWAQLLEGLAHAPPSAAQLCVPQVCTTLATLLSGSAASHSNTFTLAETASILQAAVTLAATQPQVSGDAGDISSQSAVAQLLSALQHSLVQQGRTWEADQWLSPAAVAVTEQLVAAATRLQQHGWLDAADKTGFGWAVLDWAELQLLQLSTGSLLQLAGLLAGCRPLSEPSAAAGSRRKRDRITLEDVRVYADRIAVQMRYEIQGLTISQLTQLLQSLATCGSLDSTLLQQAVATLEQRVRPNEELEARRGGSPHRHRWRGGGHTPSDILAVLQCAQVLLDLGVSVRGVLNGCVTRLGGQLTPSQLRTWLDTAPAHLLGDLACACSDVLRPHTPHPHQTPTSQHHTTQQALMEAVLRRLTASDTQSDSCQLDQLSVSKVVQLLTAQRQLLPAGPHSPGPDLRHSLVSAAIDTMHRRAAAGKLQVPQLVQLATALHQSGVSVVDLQLPDTLLTSLQSATRHHHTSTTPTTGISLSDTCALLQLLTASTGSTTSTLPSSSTAPHTPSPEASSTGSSVLPPPGPHLPPALLKQLADAVVPTLDQLSVEGGRRQALDRTVLRWLFQLPGLFQQCDPGFHHPQLAASCSRVLGGICQLTHQHAGDVVSAAIALAQLSHTPSHSHSPAPTSLHGSAPAASSRAAGQLLGLTEQLAGQPLGDVPPESVLRMLQAFQSAGVHCPRLAARVAGYLPLHMASLTPSQVLQAARLLFSTSPTVTPAQAPANLALESPRQSSVVPRDAQQQLYTRMATRVLQSSDATGSRGSRHGTGQPDWTLEQALELVRVGVAAGLVHPKLHRTVAATWLQQTPTDPPTTVSQQQYPDLQNLTQAFAQSCRSPLARVVGGGSTANASAQQLWAQLVQRAVSLTDAASQTSGVQRLLPSHVTSVLWHLYLSHLVLHCGDTGTPNHQAEQQLGQLLQASVPHWVGCYAQLTVEEQTRLAEVYAHIGSAGARGEDVVGDGPQQEAVAVWRQQWVSCFNHQSDLHSATEAQQQQEDEEQLSQRARGADSKTVLRVGWTLAALSKHGVPLDVGLCTEALGRLRDAVVASGGGKTEGSAGRRGRGDEERGQEHVVLALTRAVALSLSQLQVEVEAGMAASARAQLQEALDGLLSVVSKAAVTAVDSSRDPLALHHVMTACTAVGTAGLEDLEQQEVSEAGCGPVAVARLLSLDQRQACVQVAKAAAARLRKLRDYEEKNVRRRLDFNVRDYA